MSRQFLVPLLLGFTLVVSTACKREAASPTPAPEPAAPPPPPPAPPPFRLALPKGLEESALVIPPDNPLTAEKVELGKLLFFDKRLSADGTVACASCHHPKHAFTDGQPFSSGVGGNKGGRSAPTVINRAFAATQFWDGRAPSLEEQAKGPMVNSIEMANPDHAAVVTRLRALPGYRERFKKAFGTEEFTIDHMAKAIASFERTVLSGNSPHDRHEAGDAAALSMAAKRGAEVFRGKAGCSQCHVGFNLTDEQYHNIGVGMEKKKDPDLGRYRVTHAEADQGAFRTPTLREIALTGPYMHDGRFKTLEQVVDFYAKGGFKNKHLDPKVKPRKLSKVEKADLVEFLKALSGEGWQQVEEPRELPR